MRRNTKFLLCLLFGALLLAPVLRAEEEIELEDDTGADPYDEADDDEPEHDAESVDDKDVVTLTDANFDAELKGSKYALVMFYAPWCGHCKSMKADYAKAATELKASHPDVIIAKLDATTEKEVAGKHEIQGFPTLKWFVNGEAASEYKSGRSAHDIVRFVERKTGSATTVVETLEALKEAKGKSKVLVLAFLEKLDGDEHAAYEAAAQKLEDATFLKTTSAEVAKELGITKAPGFALGRNYSATTDFEFEYVSGEGHAAFKEGDDVGSQLESFIQSEKLPPFLEFRQENQQDIFQGGISKQVIVAAPAKQLEPGSDLFKALREAGKTTRGKVVFVTAKLGTKEDGSNSDEAGAVLKFFSLDPEGKEPQVVGFEADANKKFQFEGTPSAEAIQKFAEGVVDGTAPRLFKSAPVPEHPTEGGVATVVGTTVEKIVMDPTKDVLLEVYAPWCGHCQQLKPIYEKLAKRFAKVDSVVIAKMDGTENEHPDIDATSFPTLLFFPAEKGAQPIVFDKERTLVGMTKFIKEHAKIPFELPKKKKGGKEEQPLQHEEL